MKLMLASGLSFLFVDLGQARRISYTEEIPPDRRGEHDGFTLGIIDDDYDFNCDSCLERATREGMSKNMLGDDVWFKYRDGSQKQQRALNDHWIKYFNKKYGVDYVDDTEWDCEDTIETSKMAMKVLFPEGPESYPAELSE